MLPDLSHSLRLRALVRATLPGLQRLFAAPSLDSLDSPAEHLTDSKSQEATQLPGPSSGRRLFFREATTLTYRAPEQLLRLPRGYDYRADLWSLGCVLFELLVGRPLFGSAKDEKHLLAMQTKLLGENAFRQDPEAWKAIECGRLAAWRYPDLAAYLKESQIDPVSGDLLQKLMQLDPEKRISADEVLAHPYLSNLQALSPAESTNKHPRYQGR